MTARGDGEPGPGPVVFLSASVPTERVYPDGDRHRASARPQWIRDAVLAISRAALRRGYRLRIGAHPSIAPMILTVARELPPAAWPRVDVYQSRFFQGRYARETYELVDGVRGRLIEIDPEPDKVASIDRMRDEMLAAPGLVAAVLVGGMEGVIDEGQRFHARHRGLPAYAIASAGGAAADLLDPRRYGPGAFAGDAVAPVDPALLARTHVGYTGVARAIFDAIDPVVAAGALAPAAWPVP